MYENAIVRFFIFFPLQIHFEHFQGLNFFSENEFMFLEIVFTSNNLIFIGRYRYRYSSVTTGEEKLKFYSEPYLQSTGPWSFGRNRSIKNNHRIIWL